MTAPILMFDYLVQYRSIEVEILEAIRRVLESGQLILGPEVEAFEKAFASYLGGGGQAVGVNSGTDAIVITLHALEMSSRRRLCLKNSILSPAILVAPINEAPSSRSS